MILLLAKSERMLQIIVDEFDRVSMRRNLQGMLARVRLYYLRGQENTLLILQNHTELGQRVLQCEIRLGKR